MSKGTVQKSEAPVVEDRVQGTLHTENPEVRMFQILTHAVSKNTGNDVTFASEPFKGGGWRDDDSVGKVMSEVGKTVTAIAGRGSIAYYNSRNPRTGNGKFQSAA